MPYAPPLGVESVQVLVTLKAARPEELTPDESIVLSTSWRKLVTFPQPSYWYITWSVTLPLVAASYCVTVLTAPRERYAVSMRRTAPSNPLASVDTARL